MNPFAIALASLITGCGSRDESDEPKKDAPPKMDEDIVRMVKEFKQDLPLCKVPDIIEKRDKWSDDRPIATAATMQDKPFIWIDKDKYAALSPKQQEILVWHELGHVNGEKHPDGVRIGDEVDDIMQPFGDAKFVDNWDLQEKKNQLIKRLLEKCK